MSPQMLSQHVGGIDLTEFANRLLRLSPGSIARIAEVPPSPLDLAAETARDLLDPLHVSGHKFPYWRSKAAQIVRHGDGAAETAAERLVCRRYADALHAARTGEV